MACKWEYQRDQQRYYREVWNRENRKHLTEYQRQYRAEHPEETRQQNRKDFAKFVERHPERWKEISRESARRYWEKQKALRLAQKEAENDRRFYQTRNTEHTDDG